MPSPPSLKLLSTMALGPDDAGVLSGEDWEMRQLLKLDEKSSLIEGEPSVLVSHRAFSSWNSDVKLKLPANLKSVFLE